MVVVACNTNVTFAIKRVFFFKLETQHNFSFSYPLRLVLLRIPWEKRCIPSYQPKEAVGGRGGVSSGWPWPGVGVLAVWPGLSSSACKVGEESQRLGAVETEGAVQLRGEHRRELGSPRRCPQGLCLPQASPWWMQMGLRARRPSWQLGVPTLEAQHLEPAKLPSGRGPESHLLQKLGAPPCRTGQ